MESTIIFQGGLGNQLFQFAFLKNLEITRYKDKIIHTNTDNYTFVKDHNGYELERIFGIKAHNNMNTYRTFRFLNSLYCRRNHNKLFKYSYRILINLFPEIVDESNWEEYSATPTEKNKKAFFYGYWASPKYFSSLGTSIRQYIRFPENNLSSNSLEILKWIYNTRNVVAIHIRRGDYLTEQNRRIYGGICTDEYYRKAIDLMSNRLEDPKFIVFSNDLEYVKCTKFNSSVSKIIDFNKGRDSWQDMYLMSQADHNIIANSTFSWWGAYLNNKENNITVCPARFTNFDLTPDIYPANWIKIEG